MNYVEARDALVGLFDATWKNLFPTVKVVYDNTTKVDLDKVGERFVAAYVNIQGGVRLTLDAAPVSRYWGEMTLRVFTKEGLGTRGSLALMDTITEAMKYQTLGSLTLGCPKPTRKVTKDGWVANDLAVPFEFLR